MAQRGKLMSSDTTRANYERESTERFVAAMKEVHDIPLSDLTVRDLLEVIRIWTSEKQVKQPNDSFGDMNKRSEILENLAQKRS